MHRTQFRERVSDRSVTLPASCSSGIWGLLIDHLPFAVFCDDTDICGLPECIYIFPLTDNEGYVLAMNGFLLVHVRAGHCQISVNQNSSSCVVRIPSHMLDLLGSTYIVPCVSRP